MKNVRRVLQFSDWIYLLRNMRKWTMGRKSVFTTIWYCYCENLRNNFSRRKRNFQNVLVLLKWYPFGRNYFFYVGNEKETIFVSIVWRFVWSMLLDSWFEEGKYKRTESRTNCLCTQESLKFWNKTTYEWKPRLIFRVLARNFMPRETNIEIENAKKELIEKIRNPVFVCHRTDRETFINGMKIDYHYEMQRQNFS